MPTIKLPQAGKAVRSGTLRKWLKKAGETVAKGDLLAEVDTEEGLIQIESPVAGKLAKVLLEEGKTAAIHSPMAVIDEAKTSSPPPPASIKQSHPLPTAGKVIPILMPKAGQSMEEGTILKWRVQPGAQINKGDVIFEVETDKANMDVEATDSGRLAKIVIPEGGTLAVLQPVAYLADNDADVDAYVASTGLSIQGSEVKEVLVGAASVAASPAPMSTSPATVTASGRVKASPAARKIAAERGINLSSVPSGSGPGGRIVSTDVPQTAAASGPSRRKMTKMRKAIAKNLLLSKQTIPHFYVRLTINAEPMIAFYQAQKAQYPCSINDVVVLACASVIKEFPAFRTHLDGDELVESPATNIGIAVGLEEGLVVPVLLNADRLTLRQIGVETKRLANTARSGNLEGVGQGIFTITNLGMFGTEEFAAIINPPESAILAVGAAREAVVVKDGSMRPGKVMTLTLSTDHRIVDGLLAAKFLARLRELLESPAQLI